MTPHQFQETDHHRAIFREHFVTKGKEAAQAANALLDITGTAARAA